MKPRADRTTPAIADTLAESPDYTNVRTVQDVRAELDALKERIAKAAVLEPQPHELHCRDCFHRGRNAVLRFLQEV
jgi:hypothetical protein